MIELNFSDQYFAQADSKHTKELCKEFCNDISNLINGSVNSKILIGNILRELLDTKAYSCRSREAYKHEGKSFDIKKNAAPFVFLYVCETDFGIDRSEAWRLMNVSAEFTYMGKLTERWKDFKYSALSEMLSLEPKEREEVKPDWTIRQIREYKKELKLQKQNSQVLENQKKFSSEQDREEFLIGNRSRDDLIKLCKEFKFKLDAAYEYISELKLKLALLVGIVVFVIWFQDWLRKFFYLFRNRKRRSRSRRGSGYAYSNKSRSKKSKRKHK